MSNNTNKPDIVRVEQFGTNIVYFRNPVMMAWWAAALPGFGHILLGQYIKGSLLFICEIFINIQSHLNIGLVKTLHGDFEQTKQILDPIWILLYIPIYIFSIWDSYHNAKDINRSIAPLTPSNLAFNRKAMGAFELNLFTPKKPLMALFWSLIFPGAGQFYSYRLLESQLLSIWFIAICYYSHFFEGILYLLIGNIHHANEVINIEWFMFLPSIFCFSAYNAYSAAIETNLLLRYADIKKLKDKYQDPGFSVCFPNSRER